MKLFSLSALLVTALSVASPAASSATASTTSPATSSTGRLLIKVLRHVDCTRKAEYNDEIDITFTIALLNGTVLYETDPNDVEMFTLGSDEVPEGWNLGIVGMCIGDKRELTIPPQYGWGDQPDGLIPANATLLTNATLIGIKGVSAT